MDILVILLIAMVPTTILTVACVLGINSLIRKANGESISDAEKKQSRKLNVWLLVNALGMMLGLLLTAYGFANPVNERMEYGTCYRCDGTGFIGSQNAITGKCSVCNGTGVGGWIETDGSIFTIIGVLILIAAFISMFVYSQKKREMASQ